jgi:hypothetical protein
MQRLAAEQVARRPLLGNDGDDFRNHVTSPAHDHRIADPDILAPHLVLVVQRRVGHRDAADEDRLQPGDRRDRAGAADLDVNAEHLGQRLFGRELVGDGKTRRPRDKTELILPVEAVDLVDHAIDVVRQASGATFQFWQKNRADRSIR